MYLKIQKKHYKIVAIAVSIIICVGIIGYKNIYTKNNVFATNLDEKIDLNNDGTKEKVEFNNGGLKIYSAEGKVMLKKAEDKTVYTKLAFVKDKKTKDTKIMFQNKTKDTSSTLSYSIYKMEGSVMKEVVHKENIYKGIVTVKNDTDIIEETPEYTKTDSNAVPTYTIKNYLSLVDDKIVLVKTEKIKYKMSSNIASSTQYYKNPSYAEIEKIIETVAYEKQIPVTVLKSIAWQESKGADSDNDGITNWRQFVGGQPLIGYDKIGIGIMQVSDYASTDTAYINRLKYDIEFNIREGAEILLTKWSLQNSSVTYKTPKVGNGSPNYLEHWYYAIWAYNSYGERNNPATNYTTAYQTIVIGHANETFNMPMLDLYKYNPSLFSVGVLPRANIAEINGENAGKLKIKNKDYKYLATTKLNIRDVNDKLLGSYNINDVLTIKSDPIINDIYVKYYVEGSTLNGYVVGNWLKPVGDVNSDRIVDLYDFVKESKNINGNGEGDINGDGVVDINDIALTAKNYNFSIYKDDIKN